MPPTTRHLAALSLTAAVLAVSWTARADDAQLQEKIKQLEKRISELEGKVAATSTNLPPSVSDPMKDFLQANQISGFVSASYLYDFNRPADGKVTGRTFDVNHDSFTVDKAKVVLQKPVDYSADKWDAGYEVDLIFGQDAAFIQSTGLSLGPDADLEQAYGTVNVPIGRGLQVSFGKMVTLMGVEVIEEVANPNWSEGNQFLFVENFTSTGVQLAYKWTDKIDTEFRVFNGWDVAVDSLQNFGKSFMGRIGFAPDDKTSLALIGYGGPEEVGISSAWRKGADVVVSRKINDHLTLQGQGDYGQEDRNAALHDPTRAAEWWAGGLWAAYSFNDKIGVALRGDYLNDANGARTIGVLPAGSTVNAFGFPGDIAKQELESVTFTVNYTPIKALQIRPEIRWDHSSAKDAFEGSGMSRHPDQLTTLIGMAYLF